jgi:glutamate synthase domain-containing protein 3
LGQRYIGDGIKGSVRIYIKGTAGNDLGAFMDGPEIEVFGSGQDGIGNTMNSGKIIIHGNASDIAGNAMRGGEIYIREDVGYRSGIHMKSYMEKFPVIVIGGKAGNFLGEYMAGGVIILLGIKTIIFRYIDTLLHNDRSIVGNYLGTGMHGGRIYIKEDVDNYKLGKEVIKSKIDSDDKKILEKYINNYSKYFKNEVDTSAYSH